MTADEVMALIRASDKPHYCYVLKRPNGEPFYVGIGTKNRILHHARDARSETQRSYKISLIRKIWVEGGDIVYDVDSFFDDRKEAGRREVDLIQEYGRSSDGGVLCNLTDGGDGTSGYVLSKEARTRIGEARRGKRQTKEARARMSKSKVALFKSNPSLAENMAERAREWWADEANRILASSRTSALWSDPSYREKMAAAQEYTEERMAKLHAGNRARMADPLEIEKMSIASKAMWSDPEFRDRHRAAMVAARPSPKAKEKFAAANKVAWDDPARRESWAEAMRVRWRDPERRKAMIAGRGTPVFFNGTQYASVREAAEVEGYGKTTIRRWVAAGLDAPPPKKKRVVSAETRAKIGAGHKGKTLSDEARAQISAKLTGRKNGPPSEETRRKIGDAHRGLKRSEEVRQNISVAQRARFERERANGGITYPPRTPEQRAKHRKPIEINGVRYDGTDVAVAALGVGKTTIKRWLTAGTHGARRLELKEAA